MQGAGLSDVLKEYKDKSMDSIMEDFEKIPFFMRELPQDQDIPQLEALKAMAYEGEPDEIAEHFKGLGNESYRASKFKDAVAHYTKALDQKCGICELDLQCFLNRAQCHLVLKNYRRCINDCTQALALDAANSKGWYRSGRAFLALGKFDEVLVCCEKGLANDPDNAGLIEIKETGQKRKAAALEAERAREAQRQLESDQKRTLELALDSRGVTRMLENAKGSEHTGELNVELASPLDALSELLVPIVFLYPLDMQSDIIKQASEHENIESLVRQLVEPRAPWMGPEYELSGVQVFAPTSSGGLARVALQSRLCDVLASKTPDIIMLNGAARLFLVPTSKSAAWLAQWDKKQVASRLSLAPRYS